MQKLVDGTMVHVHVPNEAVADAPVERAGPGRREEPNVCCRMKEAQAAGLNSELCSLCGGDRRLIMQITNETGRITEDIALLCDDHRQCGLKMIPTCRSLERVLVKNTPQTDRKSVV